MKKFLFSIILVSIVPLAALIALGLLMENKREKTNVDYHAAIIDKHERHESLKSPKVFIVGGSNLAFGMDSKRLQDYFNKPVVNLGLHAGLGLEFMLNEILDIANPEDIVLFSIEYQLRVKGQQKLRHETVKVYPKAQRYARLSYTELTSLWLDDLRKDLKSTGQTHKSNKEYYQRSQFNEFGDYIGHLAKPSTVDLSTFTARHYQPWAGISLLKTCIKTLNEKNIQTYFTYPCYPQSLYQQDSIVINKLKIDLEESLPVQFIGAPQDFVLDDSLFFDTNYHLTGAGRTLRTSKLIQELSNNHIAKSDGLKFN